MASLLSIDQFIYEQIQLFSYSVQAHLHVSLRQLHYGGALAYGTVVVIEQRHQSALLGLQQLDGATQRLQLALALDDIFQPLGFVVGQSGEASLVDRAYGSPLAPYVRQRRVAGYAVEPCGERAAAVETVERVERLQERVLRQLLGILDRKSVV